MNNYKFFQNKNCEYFPCHQMSAEELNCLFCYCPLYCLKDNCGGDFVYLESGVKSCVNCTKPHDRNGYEHVMRKLKQVTEQTKDKNLANKTKK